ncbi:MAG: DUF4419 domain-containing protein [Bacteroidia bacterium]|nr:DUF4419 domain-containing protein [Bacteroidia bacterium]
MKNIKLENIPIAEKTLSEYPTAELIKNISEQTIHYKVAEDKLVSFGEHNFLGTIRQAWQDHRPIVISPDMIWLLICQAWTLEISHHSEKYRNSVLKYPAIPVAQIDISVVGGTSDMFDNMFSKLEEGIRKAVHAEWVDTLSNDFSTTGPIEKTAGLITMMSSFSSYLEYTARIVACGIPSIELLGHAEDWQKLLDKTEFLAQQQGEGWVQDILPLVKSIQASAAGDIDLDFWRSIFKTYEIDSKGKRSVYTDREFIDGWITHFFPFDRFGELRREKRISIRRLTRLPAEISHVPITVKRFDSHGVFQKEEVMYLMAGFMGASQDHETKALKPVIGWLLSPEEQIDTAKLSDPYKDYQLNFKNLTSFPSGLLKYLSEPRWPEHIFDRFPHLRLVPRRRLFSSLQKEGFEIREIMELLKKGGKRIRIVNLSLHFIDKVDIPASISRVNGLGKLEISGKLDEDEIYRIRRLLPYVDLRINGVFYKSLVVP